MPETAYRADIDGLRAVAILSVVLFHSGLVRLSGGFTGVDIFFVISGYLIGGHIWTELRAGAFSYRSFYRRRAKRILPALYVVTLFTLLAGLLLLSPRDLAQLGRSAVASTLSVSNILFWGTANYFAGSSERNPLLMTWSLGIEEQFYLVVPVLMAIVARTRSRWILPTIAAVSLGSFAFAWIAASHYPMAAFYLLPARAWELGAGAILALRETRHQQKPASRGWMEIGGIAALALMIAAMLAPRSELTASAWAVLPAVAGAALAIALPGSWVNRHLLSAAPFRFIGKISYSWYLWHWPLFSLLHILYGGAIPALRETETIALSFALAVASYFLVEQPFRRSAQPANRLLARYAIASAILLAACAIVWSSHGVPERLPALAAMENPGERLRNDPCLAGLDRDEPNASPACYRALESQPLVALWGDSHAAAVASAVRALAQTQGYGFAQLDKASCPPLTRATHFIPRIPTLAEGCLRFNNAVLVRLRDDPRIRIVVLSAAWAAPLYRDWENGWLTADPASAQTAPTLQATSALFVQSLESTIASLQASGKQVIVLDDVPAFTIDPIWRVESERIPARRRLARWLAIPDAQDPGTAVVESSPNVTLALALLEQIAARDPGVELIDPKPALCSANGPCAYRVADSLLYIDSSHLSPDGARRALGNFQFPPAATLAPDPRSQSSESQIAR